MAYQISGNTVIDNSRNGSFANLTASSKLGLSASNSGRPASPANGTFRWNNTVSKLEVFISPSWYEVAIGPVVPLPSETRRGIYAAGSPNGNTIDYITIGWPSNAIDFGDLTVSRSAPGACSSSTRGVFGGGGGSNTIDYITIATTGNATDFGDLTQARRLLAGCSSSTRGVFGGGSLGETFYSIIDYITIASTGNAIDFGDLTGTYSYLAACSSSTRGIFAGGSPTSPYYNTSSHIQYITVASTGNATTFGNLTVQKSAFAGCSSSTRGVFGGGFSSPIYTTTNVIDYITIASTGNATDFGDLSSNQRIQYAACSSPTMGTFGGGESPGTTNLIDYITIATTGNAIDFGDLTVSRFQVTACSDGHGGLG